MAALLMAFLSLGATPARADLAGICRAAGASSDCVNKIELGGRRPDERPEPREPACDPECRRQKEEEEKRVLDATPDAVETKPLEPDPAEETDWHFASVSERDQELEPRLASANLLVLSVALGTQPELWVPALVFAGIWYVGTQTDLPQRAVSAMNDLRKVRAKNRNDTQDCKDAVAGSRFFCDKNSCKRGVKDCTDARFRLVRSRMCLATRLNVRDICHAGADDPGHEEALDGALSAAARCERKVAELCDCSQSAKGALFESARRVCEGISGCSTLSDCATILGVVKAVQSCRFSLKNISLRCPGEAAPFDLSRMEQEEAACRAALVRHCGKAAP